MLWPIVMFTADGLLQLDSDAVEAWNERHRSWFDEALAAKWPSCAIRASLAGQPPLPSGLAQNGPVSVSKEQRPDLPSVVSEPSVQLPVGYRYGVTRYADIILREAFPRHFRDLVETLDEFRIGVDELLAGGGSRSTHTARFDATLASRGWGKRNISVSRLIDDKPLHVTRGHEIDMFAVGSEDDPYPGVGVEMEWNNKDPFFDRDLLNFQALHREGALAVGVIVTRGPTLQTIIGNTIRSSATVSSLKYGQSTTHWNKLIPRVNLGGGGECPLFLIGIEPERVPGIEVVQAAYEAGTRLP